MCGWTGGWNYVLAWLAASDWDGVIFGLEGGRVAFGFVWWMGGQRIGGWGQRAEATTMHSIQRGEATTMRKQRGEATLRYIPKAYVVMAYRVMAFRYIPKAYIVMAYIVMSFRYIPKAYVVWRI